MEYFPWEVVVEKVCQVNSPLKTDATIYFLQSKADSGNLLGQYLISPKSWLTEYYFASFFNPNKKPCKIMVS